MKRLLMTILACVISLNLFIAGAAQAQPLLRTSPIVGVEGTTLSTDTLEQVKTKILPQFESILTPQQRDQLESAVVDKKISLRKAFKSINLTPDQKSQLGTVFKSLPKKDFFASLTPEQKKELFMKKKELFKPTPEEIAKLKAKKAE